MTTTTFSEDTSLFNTGYNTVNGYVVSWSGIQPGADGDFKMRAEASTSAARYAYAFSVFKHNGIFDQKTAQSFRDNILSKGGTEHPMTLYKRFRGQEPTIEALLERNGIKRK